MKIILFILALAFQSAWALSSPFPSDVVGLTIPNSSQVDLEGKIFRGMAPGKLSSELVNFKITDILIFKNQTKAEVDQEILTLQNLGYKKNQITHIPFEWKNYSSLTLACEQTLDALSLLVKIKNSPNRKAFFHCTVGEDRTGHLAGLFRLLTQKTKIKDVFQKELCAHGFAEGNKFKPKIVIDQVNADLKELFFILAEKIEKGEISENFLNKEACQTLNTSYYPQDFKCK